MLKHYLVKYINVRKLKRIIRSRYWVVISGNSQGTAAMLRCGRMFFNCYTIANLQLNVLQNNLLSAG